LNLHKNNSEVCLIVSKRNVKKQFLLPSGILCIVSCKKLTGFSIPDLLNEQYKRETGVCQFILGEKKYAISDHVFLSLKQR